ncbi:hypothetical protein [Thermosulfurimonas sp.]|nr:hypothetical protein [Thermosulfurimonas sp.]
MSRLKRIPFYLWWVAAAMLGSGIVLQGFKFVHFRAATLCLSCIGLQ